MSRAIVVRSWRGGFRTSLARAISAELGAALGQKVIVENRTGAGGTIGTASVAKARPTATRSFSRRRVHTINGSLYAKLPYDPIGDFTGVAHIGNRGIRAVVGAALPVRTVGEFVDYARANAGKLNYSTAGSGSATHLSMAYFAALAGIDWCTCRTRRERKRERIGAGRSHAVIAANIGALGLRQRRARSHARA